MSYIEDAVHDLHVSLGFIDCNNSTEIAVRQGGIRALQNVLGLHEAALKQESEGNNE